MNRIPKLVGNWLAREPVMLGAVALAWLGLAGWGPAVMGACTLTVGWVVRLASRPERTAVEDVEVARYVGTVEGRAALLPHDPEPTTGAPLDPWVPPTR